MSNAWTSDLFALLPHPSTSRVLMLAGEDGWSLPSTQVTGKIDLTPGLATGEMSRCLGFPILAYRYAHIAVDEHRNHQTGIFAFEGGEHVETLSARSRWVSRADLSELRLKHSDHREVIDAYLRELETSIIPERRQPWERPGWFALATSWITETLGSLGYDVLAAPEQVRWWSLSSVLRVATVRGDVYFKTSARQPLFANEPVLLSYLASQFPRRVPVLIASDASRGWMLLEDVGPTLGGELSLERKIEIVQMVGRLQRNTAGHVDKLIDLGSVDRRPYHLIPRIEPLLNDPLAVATLTADEIDTLHRAAPRIAEMCSRLSDYAVPSTLIHGDLHPENIAAPDGMLAFFDWTEACIAHPFMDMFIVFNERDEAVHRQLRDAYLALWTDVETMERLRELWSLCGVVHAFHHAVSYQTILHHTEERSKRELGDAPPFLLRKALRYVDKLRKHEKRRCKPRKSLTNRP